MIPYYLLLIWFGISIFICYSSNAHQDRLFLVLAFIPLMITLGLRGEMVGMDTVVYVAHFQAVAKGDAVVRFEIGYHLIERLVSLISTDPKVLFCTLSGLYSMLYARFIYKSSNCVWLTFLILFFLCHFLWHANMLRQSIAVAFTCNAFLCLNNRMKFLIWIFVGSLFHTSAICFLLLIFVDKINIKELPFLLVVTAVLGCLTNWYFSRYGSNDVVKAFLQPRQPTISIVWALMMIVFASWSFFYFKRCKWISNEKKQESLCLAKVVVLGYVLYEMSFIVGLFDRISFYFIPFIAVLIPRILVFMRHRAAFTGICVIIYGVYFHLMLERSSYIPYTT